MLERFVDADVGLDPQPRDWVRPLGTTHIGFSVRFRARFWWRSAILLLGFLGFTSRFLRRSFWSAEAPLRQPATIR